MSFDRLSNMLSAIKNSALAGNSYVEILHTKECEGVAKVLEEAGFLDDVKTFKEKGKSFKMLRLEIAKDDETPIISEVKRISKPGRRLYTTSEDIKEVKGGTGVLVVSTSRGIMSGKEAKRKKLGGELICKVF